MEGKKITFVDILSRIIHGNMSNKLNEIVKEKIYIVPLIYFLGTIILIIRNKIYELPFSPISLVHFAVIVSYFIIFLVTFSFIELFYFDIFDKIKKIRIKKIKSIIEPLGEIVLLVLILICVGFVFSFLFESIDKTIKIIVLLYIFYPIFEILFSNDDYISTIITILFFMMIVFQIPISLGGFKGKEVIFHDENDGTELGYIYFGNYDGLYQLQRDGSTYLIPIDKGYIIYNRPNK